MQIAIWTPPFHLLATCAISSATNIVAIATGIITRTKHSEDNKNNQDRSHKNSNENAEGSSSCTIYKNKGK